MDVESYVMSRLCVLILVKPSEARLLCFRICGIESRLQFAVSVALSCGGIICSENLDSQYMSLDSISGPIEKSWSRRVRTKIMTSSAIVPESG